MKTDGGPAFPLHIDKAATSVEDFPGMSLRDWFAGQALGGIVSTVREKAAAEAITEMMATGKTNAENVYAAMAYEVADAMLAERAK